MNRYLEAYTNDNGSIDILLCEEFQGRTSITFICHYSIYREHVIRKQDGHHYTSSIDRIHSAARDVLEKFHNEIAG